MKGRKRGQKKYKEKGIGEKDGKTERGKGANEAGK